MYSNVLNQHWAYYWAHRPEVFLCLLFPLLFSSVLLFFSLFIFLLFFSVLSRSFGFGFILFWHYVFEIGSCVL